MQDERRRKPKISKTSNKRLALVLVICGVIIIIVLMVVLFSKTVGYKNYHGPVILSACDVPNQYLKLFVSVDEDGSIIIIPIWKDNNDINNATFWIRLIDTCDFKWNCTGEIQAIELHGSDRDQNYFSSTIKSEGIGRNAISHYIR